MKKEEIEKQTDKFYPNANVVTHEATEHQGFVKGALWMQEQLEQNRLAHCNSMTEEEYNRESDFVSNFFEEHNRTSFPDANKEKQLLADLTDKAYQYYKARYPESTISKTTYEVIFLEGYKAGLITNRL